MSLIIDEDHLGADTELIYPNLQSCLSLTCRTRETLTGTHLTVGTSTKQAIAIFKKMIEWHTSPALSIYLIGSLEHFRTNVKKGSEGLRWQKALVKTIRTSFKCPSQRIYAFDLTKKIGIGGAARVVWLGVDLSTCFCDYVLPGQYTETWGRRGDNLRLLKMRQKYGSTDIAGFSEPGNIKTVVFNTGATLVQPSEFTEA